MSDDSVKNKIDQIKIFENVLDEDTRRICDSLLARPNWSYNFASKENNGNALADTRFWHMNNLEEDWFFNTHFFNIIMDLIGDGAEKWKPVRIYANGQTATQSGSIHTDDGEWTFLYYSTRDWKPEYKGSTLYFADDEGKELLKTVPYVSNQGVWAPADIFHYAEAPSLEFKSMRTTVAYKLERIE